MKRFVAFMATLVVSATVGLGLMGVNCAMAVEAEKALALDAANQDKRRERALSTVGALTGWDQQKKIDWAARLEREEGALGSFTVDYVMGEVWSREQLNHRDRSIVTLAILSALNLTEELADHVPFAIQGGLKPEEVREVFLQVAGYAGFPKARSALRVANPLLERFAGGVSKVEPAESITGVERRERANRVLARISGKSTMVPGETVGALVGNMGAIVDSGIDFVFGEIWARPQLSPRDRSLVVVSVLTALGRGDELNIHVPAALRHGVTKSELEEIMVTTFAYAGAPLAVEGMAKVMKYGNLP